MGQEVAIAHHRHRAAHGFSRDAAAAAGHKVAVERQGEVFFGELLDGELHSGGLLLDHAVVERALPGLALVVLQHIGFEGKFELGHIAGRANFKRLAGSIALAEVDPALERGVSAHDLESLRRVGELSGSALSGRVLTPLSK